MTWLPIIIIITIQMCNLQFWKEFSETSQHFITMISFIFQLVMKNYYCVHWVDVTWEQRNKINVAAFTSVAQLCLTLRPHGLQHARPPCPPPTPGVYSNSCPLSQWCHSTISSSVVPFSSHLQSFPASGSFQMSQFFTSGGRSIGVSTLGIRTS